MSGRRVEPRRVKRNSPDRARRRAFLDPASHGGATGTHGRLSRSPKPWSRWTEPLFGQWQSKIAQFWQLKIVQFERWVAAPRRGVVGVGLDGTVGKRVAAPTAKSLAVAIRLTRRADLVEQPLRRQLRELLKARVDYLLVRFHLVGHGRTRRISSRTGRQIPVQLARPEPIVDRPTTYPEAPRQLRLRDGLFQIVLQQHPGLPSVHPCAHPAPLASPTERLGATSSTSQNCAILGCHK